MPTEIFPNAPLVETIFQIRFSGKLAIDSNKHLFQEAVIDELPLLEVPVSKEPVHHNLLPYRLSNEAKTELIYFSINTFSYHATKYECFEKFAKKCLKFCAIFGKIFAIDELKSTGLRYIDHIPALRDKGIIPLRSYLNFGYKLPKAIPEKLENFTTKIISQIGSGKLSTTIKLESLRDKKQTEIIILDFDYIKEGSLSFCKLKEYLEESHKHTKEVFINLISDEYKEVMRKSPGGEDVC